MELFVLLIVILLVLIQVALLRWVFRINTIVKLLEQIRDEVKKK